MLFNSFSFIVFFPIVIILYFATPQKYRWILLLIASYYFYMSWKLEYGLLLLTSTLIDYFSGLQINKSDNKRVKKLYLIISIITNLGLLFVFKYFNFFTDTLKMSFELISLSYHIPHYEILLPVGISFYTFQSMSYTIDIYRGDRKPERHFGIFALYVSFFPQLVAGPIETSTSFLPQLRNRYTFDYSRIQFGLKLMAWGFFKKVFIADRLALLIDPIFENPQGFEGIQLFLASVFFVFQLYCDFSGYADIAIGSALIMGYELSVNFRMPYFAKTITEFWNRWHITLKNWLSNYFIRALGGFRISKRKVFRNLFIFFVVMGLWHGASWTFAMWGILNWFYIVFSNLTKKARLRLVNFIGLTKLPRFHSVIKICGVLGLNIFAIIFFRAKNFSDAFYIIQNLFTGMFDFILSSFNSFFELNFISPFDRIIRNTNMQLFDIVLLFIGLFIAIFLHKIADSDYSKLLFESLLKRKTLALRFVIYVFILLLTLYFGVFQEDQFIYFQF